MRQLTQERLKELLEYDPETGEFKWAIFRCNRSKKGDKAGWDDGRGYFYITINGKDYNQSQLAWLYVFGKFPGSELDHINFIKSDNRINNLRKCTKSENLCHRRRQKNNQTGFKGVSWDKERNKWYAYIVINRKMKNLGRFDDKHQAAFEYDKAAIRLHGEFAVTNFPRTLEL